MHYMQVDSPMFFLLTFLYRAEQYPGNPVANIVKYNNHIIHINHIYHNVYFLSVHPGRGIPALLLFLRFLLFWLRIEDVVVRPICD